MAVKRKVFVLLIVSILNQTIGVPLNRITRDVKNNEVGHENDKKADSVSAATFISNESGKLETPKTEQTTKTSTTTKATATTKSNRKPLESIPFSDEDDDDFDSDDMQYAPSNGAGGSNLISLFNLSGNLLPGLSGGATIQNIIKYMVKGYTTMKPVPFLRRRSMANNEIERGLDDTNSSFGEMNEGKGQVKSVFKESNNDKEDRLRLNKGKEVDNSLAKDLPLKTKSDKEKKQNGMAPIKLESQKLESDEEEENSLSDESDEKGNNAAEESVESEENESSSKQTNSETEESSESDSDEPPGGGDGEGGGVLGFLAQFSGGEDGQSDLGSLLGAISGVVVNLSGDGVDVNNIVASGLGLLLGLLSEGDENPGSVLASYLLTSLDTLTGGGANNNGAFFGKFISTLVKGASAAGDGSGSDEEMSSDAGTDSFGFFKSFIMGLLGSMSNGSHSSEDN